MLNHSRHTKFTIFYTTETLDGLMLTLPSNALLDEQAPFWWVNPPKELVEVEPIVPHIRVLRAPANSEHGKPKTFDVRAYLLTFHKTDQAQEDKETGITIREPWCWANYKATAEALPFTDNTEDPQRFYIICSEQEHQQLKRQLLDGTNEYLNKCQ